MKGDLTVVLSVYEGEGMQPREKWKVVVTAHLEGKVVSTDPVPLSSEPNISQEMSWDVSPSTLHKYKNARVPLRIECHAVDSNNDHHLVGYIILPLVSAVQGEMIDKKWHRLLGGPSVPQRMPPRLLLCLNVFSEATKGAEPMNVCQENELHIDSENIRELNFPSRRSVSKSSGVQRQNSVNSVQEVLNRSLDSRSGMLCDSKKNTDLQTKEKHPSTKGEIMTMDKDLTRMATRLTSRSSVNNLRAVGEVKQEVREYSVDDEDRDDSENRFNAKTRNLRSCKNQSAAHSQNAEHPAYTSPRGISRHSMTSPSKDSHIQPSVNQSGGTYSPAGGIPIRRTNQQSGVLSSPNSSIKENGHKSTSQAANENDFVMAIPSTSSGTIGRSKPSTEMTQIIPRLNENGGFFQIGPIGDPDEKTFHFSVTIVYAKNLDQVLPKDLKVAESDTLRFCYSLLGHIVYTDSIKDLTNPDFLAERAAGKVRSTSLNVSSYFQQHPEFPIHLLIGDVCLATSNINLSSFESAGDCLTPETPITVEGSFPLLPVMLNPLLWSPAKEPVLGVIIQLSVSLENESNTQYYPPMIKENFGTGRALIMMDYLSSASSSDDASEYEKEHRIPWSNQNDGSSGYYVEDGKNKKYKVKKQRHGQRDLLSRWQHQRKSLMYDAAMEVETWKEDQQHIFWEQWSAREAELQNHLASEWQERISSVETQLQSRLDQCDTLHKTLTSALLNVGIKEKNVALREEKVRSLQQEVKRQKRELKQRESASVKVDKRQRKRKMEEADELQVQLQNEKSRRKQLQRQVRELEAASRAATEAAEATQLGNQVKMQEIKSLKEDKERLVEQLNAALKRKQYYKLQWVRLVGQMHNMHTARVHDTPDVRMDMERSEPYFVNPQPNKQLKYKEDNTVHDIGGKITRRVEMARRGQSDAARGETEFGESGRRERWRKGVGPGKSSQPSKILENVLKERQELERRVRRNDHKEAGQGSTDYSAAIKEAERKLRSLETGNWEAS
nr:centrosomal protein of 120 kDa-like [Procambarus clarkii]